MSSKVVPIINPKQTVTFTKQPSGKKCVVLESTSAEPSKQPVEEKRTNREEKNNFIKVVQDNNVKKCVYNVTTSCNTNKCNETLDSKVEQNIKKANVTSCKKSEKPKGKVKTQLRETNSDDTSKNKVNDKIKQKKNKLVLLEKSKLLNDDIASSSTRLEQQQKAETPEKFKKLKETFPEYISIPTIKKILKSQTSTNVQYVEGHIRINPKYCKNAYVTMPNELKDILIVGVRDRNRAFNGDLVVVSINEEEKWQKCSNGEIQKTGTVVCILEKIHPRKAVGCLKTDGTIMLLQPRDHRIPLIKINPKSLPAMYNNTSSLFEEVLFLATIHSWIKPYLCIGKIERMLGTIGNLEVELNAILLEYDINIKPFSDRLLEELPSSENILTSSDIKEREDWRHLCVFTIDPATAVDLDDAVSCTVMSNGNYEVGVHIADVAHYLQFSSPLDREIAKRATTVYLPNQVYHMLPRELCNICSLLPGQDKLTFSVIWEITPDAQIVKHRFAKTIINSCYQMNYEQAQLIIENLEDFPKDNLEIKGNFTPSNLCDVVKNLFKLSKQMEIKRYANGALRINLPKFHIILDKESGLPVSYDLSERKDSNRLIEEFMLLANMTVATHLYETVPKYALLRNHNTPSVNILTKNKNILQRFGIHLDIETAGDLYSSIKRYEIYTELQFEEYIYLTKWRLLVLKNFCSKAMARATYNCASKFKNAEDLWHYALNVPFYTHFTSPIRRYPDIIVHRLLYSTLFTNVKLPHSWNSEQCSKIAANCNLRKYYAKVAEEKSQELYFTYFIDMTGPVTVVAIVCDVKKNYIEVILCDTGIKLKVYLNNIKEETISEYKEEDAIIVLTLTWKKSNITQVITIFTIVHLRIQKHDDLFQLNPILLEPCQNDSC